MRRTLFTLLGGVILIGILSAARWMTLEFTSHAHYTERDITEYLFYTPALLKGVPRITSEYAFEYEQVQGPLAWVYSVQFTGTTDVSQLREYLLSEGYQRQQQCDIEAECWLSAADHNTVVTLYRSPLLKVVGIQIYRSLKPLPEPNFQPVEPAAQRAPGQ